MNPTERPRISATIITYNEERQIERCIQSVHDWCDEVIVLDSHSKDRTKELATAFPKVKFAAHDFDGHIQQKNRAIDMAAGPWIFSLDADEEASPELAQNAARFVAENPEAQGVRIWRTTWHLGRFIRHGGWRHARYRLFRKGEGVWGGENPHDQIFLKDRPHWQRNRGPTISGDLIHYSFRDLSHQVDTINKFSSIIAFTRSERGTRFSLFKMIYKSMSKFTELYIVKAGFLDGMAGLIIAVSSAYATFLRWAKLYELKRTGLERPSNVRPDYRVPDAKSQAKDTSTTNTEAP
ncbi:MAG: glycosyltransferase family 2 protein [bacterium]|nr:glycosyltransferase family 2 protein [bacterium]